MNVFWNKIYLIEYVWVRAQDELFLGEIQHLPNYWSGTQKCSIFSFIFISSLILQLELEMIKKFFICKRTKWNNI